jgi:soluble lytic murein transglycosylase-like protein
MDVLTAAGVCVLFVTPPQPAHPCAAPAQISSHAIEQWQPLIADAARRFAVPEDWVHAVMRLESGGHATWNGRPITSSAGAMGLMQLMPGTYADMRLRYGLGPDPYDPHDNIFAGTAYLHEMFVRYGYPNLFAAYQAGPKRLDRVLSGLDSLPKSTLDYMNSLISGTGNALAVSENPTAQPPKSVPDPLFFVRAENENSSNAAAKSTSHPNELFVSLHADRP